VGAAAGAVAGVAVVGAGKVGTGLETLTSAVFEDCFEHALRASKKPRIANAASMASFCWRDQDESIVPEIVFSVRVSVDFQIVAIFVTSSAAGAVGSDMAGERPNGVR